MFEDTKLLNQASLIIPIHQKLVGFVVGWDRIGDTRLFIYPPNSTGNFYSPHPLYQPVFLLPVVVLHEPIS